MTFNNINAAWKLSTLNFGWADFDANLGVAICHNRLFNANSIEEDAILTIANSVREALGLEP